MSSDGELLRVAHGGHYRRQGACVMEWVSLILGEHVELVDGEVVVDWEGSRYDKHDAPTCAHHLIRSVAVTVNDCGGQKIRDRLAGCIPGLLRSGSLPPELGDATDRLGWRLRLRMVEHLQRVVDEPVEEHHREALELARRRAGQTPETRAERGQDSTRIGILSRRCREVRGVSLQDDLTVGLLLGVDHLYTVLACLMMRGTPDLDPVELLEELMLELEKFKAEEGLLGGDPEPLYLEQEELDQLVETLSGEGSGEV